MLSASSVRLLNRAAVSRVVGGSGGDCSADSWFRLFPLDGEVGLSRCLENAGVGLVAEDRAYPAGPRDLLASPGIGLCCDDHPVAFGGLNGKDILLLHYAAYTLRPFGLAPSHSSLDTQTGIIP